MRPTSYLDNAAASWPTPPSVLRAFSCYMEEIGGAPGRGSHWRAKAAEEKVFAVREQVARFIGVRYPTQVVFTANTTEALNIALLGSLRAGDHVVVSAAEHNSITRPLHYLATCAGVRVTHLAVDSVGRVDPRDVRRALGPETRLVALCHVNNVTGVVQPLAEISAVTRAAGVLLLVDAAQSAGHLPLDMAGGAELIAFSAHKGLLGLPGTGVLYVSPDCELSPLKHGGTGAFSESPAQPRAMPIRLESGTPNTPGIVALGAGIAEVERMGLAAIAAQESALIHRLRSRLRGLEGLTLYGSDDEPASLVSFNVGDLPAAQVSSLLDQEFGIETRGGLHCAPATHAVLGTLQQGTVRASVSPFTRESDVDRLIVAIEEIAASYERAHKAPATAR